jgi:hypothetical protein
MKRILTLTLVLVLVLISASPALAGNGNGNGGGGGGNGQGGNGNTNGQQSQNTEQHKNQNKNVEHKAEFYVLTGLVTAIEGTADAGSITVLVYGGKDTSLHGTEVVVQTNAGTRFVMKNFGPITFEEVEVGDSVSSAIGSDGMANRVTVDAEVACIPE